MADEGYTWRDLPSPDDYDPLTCLTAGELRRAGANLEEHIPDCAWVPRKDVVWTFEREPDEPSAEDRAARNVRIRMIATFLSPLRWVEIKGTLVE